MNSQTARRADLYSPLPARQFGGFLLFFHAVFLGALGLTLYAHLRHAKGVPALTEATLVSLVVIQALLYLGCFAFPTLAEHGAVWRRFWETHGKANEPGHANYWPALRWWGLYIAASVALVLAECRIDRGFQWALIAYVGQISALRFRISVPACVAIFAAYLLNRFGWSTLATWGFASWFDLLVQVTPLAALILFLGRMVVTSAERGKLILELEAAKRELERARQRDAELAVLQERERLARDLHDSLGHSLVTLTVQLEAAQRLLATDPVRTGATLTEMQKLTRTSMEDLRRSLANLRAPGLGDRPLTEALRALCADAGKRSNVSVECELSQGADRLPPVVAEVVWRVAQEGLTNAEKHAQARRVQITLAMQPNEVRLQVSDDGLGLSPDAENKPGHYGLRGLRERVEGVGGTFMVTSPGSRGTLIEARVPMIA